MTGNGQDRVAVGPNAFDYIGQGVRIVNGFASRQPGVSSLLEGVLTGIKADVDGNPADEICGAIRKMLPNIDSMNFDSRLKARDLVDVFESLDQDVRKLTAQDRNLSGRFPKADRGAPVKGDPSRIE